MGQRKRFNRFQHLLYGRNGLRPQRNLFLLAGSLGRDKLIQAKVGKQGIGDPFRINNNVPCGHKFLVPVQRHPFLRGAQNFLKSFQIRAWRPPEFCFSTANSDLLPAVFYGMETLFPIHIILKLWNFCYYPFPENPHIAHKLIFRKHFPLFIIDKATELRGGALAHGEIVLGHQGRIFLKLFRNIREFFAHNVNE
ncbi:MAG: hypothetical protein U0519_04120 [Candidatus Gracilibacteria bacterium]